MLRLISPREMAAERAHGGPRERPAGKLAPDILRLARKRPLGIFAACLMLFHLANAAMLPLMGSVLTMRPSQWAALMRASSIVRPQLVVAIFSPWLGQKAQAGGRRPLRLAAFPAPAFPGVP